MKAIYDDLHALAGAEAAHMSSATGYRHAMLRRLDRLVDALETVERFRTKHKVEETVPTLDQYDTVLGDIHSLLKEGLL